MQGNPGGGAADHREWERQAQARSGRGSPPPAQGAADQPGRRRFRAIRLHRQFAPMLIAITLLCTLGLTGLAYAGARSYAISGAEAQALQAIQVERQLVLPQNATLRLQDGRLVLTSAGASLVLNDNTSLVDQTLALTGDDATIYQAEGASLVAVATNLPDANSRGAPISGSRALGDALSGSAIAALQSSCAPASPPSCHQTYQGIITIRGLSYAAALVPLFDSGGAYVGALGLATPLETVTAPAVQLAVMLLIAGLLLALLSLVTGFWFFGSLAERTIGALDLRLRLVADAAAELERLAQLQATRAARQDRVAQQVSAQARALDSMAEVMEQGRASLRDASGEIWAEMSHPGGLPDPTSAVRLAQQAAVTTAQVGSAAEDARDVCGQLVGLMNHILAESAIVGDGGLEMEARAKDLRSALESVETTVGERLLQRSLLLRRVRAASRRVRHFLPAPFSRESAARAGSGSSGSSSAPITEPHPMAAWSWPSPDPTPSTADADSPPSLAGNVAGGPGSPTRTPRGLQRPPQPQAAPRTPRLIRTGELPPVLPSERPVGSGYLGARPDNSGYLGVRPPGSGHLGDRPPGSGLLSGRGAEPSLPRRARPPQDPPRDDWTSSDSRHSGWLG